MTAAMPENDIPGKPDTSAVNSLVVFIVPWLFTLTFLQSLKQSLFSDEMVQIFLCDIKLLKVCIRCRSEINPVFHTRKIFGT